MEKLGEERLKKIGELIRNPPPDSKILAAKEFGVDLSLMFRWLKLSPQQRIEEARERMILLEEVKRQAESARGKR
jgi:pantoate kinase